MTVYALSPQESKWACHASVPHLRAGYSVELSKLAKPVTWLDQLEMVVSQTVRKELWREVCEPQALLVQQWVVDVEQWLPPPLKDGQEGPKKQVA